MADSPDRKRRRRVPVAPNPSRPSSFSRLASRTIGAPPSEAKEPFTFSSLGRRYRDRPDDLPSVDPLERPWNGPPQRNDRRLSSVRQRTTRGVATQFRQAGLTEVNEEVLTNFALSPPRHASLRQRLNELKRGTSTTPSVPSVESTPVQPEPQTERRTSAFKTPEELEEYMHQDLDDFLDLKTPDTEKAPPPTEEVSEDACAICLLVPDFAARPVCCSHVFCFACLTKWADVTNRCPLCKALFKEIVKLIAANPGQWKDGDRVSVPDKEIKEEDEEEDDLVCEVCQDASEDSLLLLCDGCDRGYHTFCVGLGDTVPRGDWFCDSCVSIRTASLRSARRQQPPRSTRRTRNNNNNASEWLSRESSQASNDAHVTENTLRGRLTRRGRVPPGSTQNGQNNSTSLAWLLDDMDHEYEEEEAEFTEEETSTPSSEDLSFTRLRRSR